MWKTFVITESSNLMTGQKNFRPPFEEDTVGVFQIQQVSFKHIQTIQDKCW